jgi:hypothetical protein
MEFSWPQQHHTTHHSDILNQMEHGCPAQHELESSFDKRSKDIMRHNYEYISALNIPEGLYYGHVQKIAAQSGTVIPVQHSALIGQ